METKESYISVINSSDEVWEGSLKAISEDGELLLAYKNTNVDLENTDKEILYQVIVKRLYNEDSKRRYTIFLTTSKRSYVLSRVPIDYVKNELITDLENLEVSEKILANFCQIVKDIEE